MAVPDTSNFNLLSVKNEIQSEGSFITNLYDAFNYANIPHFDVRYIGNKNNLLNFRNYGGGSTPPPSCSTWIFTGDFEDNERFVIKYVDCDDENIIISTSRSSSVNNEIFCVKRIYEVSMGSYSFIGTQLDAGVYSGTYSQGNSGLLSGGTSLTCGVESITCYNWTLAGTGLYPSYIGNYEVTYIDCDNIERNIIASANDTLTRNFCAKDILSYSLGDTYEEQYDKTINGPLPIGTYSGQLAVLDSLSNFSTCQ